MAVIQPHSIRTLDLPLRNGIEEVEVKICASGNHVFRLRKLNSEYTSHEIITVLPQGKAMRLYHPSGESSYLTYSPATYKWRIMVPDVDTTQYRIIGTMSERTYKVLMIELVRSLSLKIPMVSISKLNTTDLATEELESYWLVKVNDQTFKFDLAKNNGWGELQFMDGDRESARLIKVNGQYVLMVGLSMITDLTVCNALIKLLWSKCRIIV